MIEDLLLFDWKVEAVSENDKTQEVQIQSPGVVRFDPEILISDGPEQSVEDHGEKFLEREIIQYLQNYKYQKDGSNRTVWPARGTMKRWNLVRQRFHENREVFVSGIPRVKLRIILINIKTNN